MSEKISAMPAATFMLNADILPIVQGLLNKSITKALLLTAASGEDISLQSAGASVDVDSGGGVTITTAPAQGYNLTDGTNIYMQVDSVGGVSIVAAPGESVLVQGGSAGAGLQISPGGAVNLAADPGQAITMRMGPTAEVTINGFGQVTIKSTGGQVLQLLGSGAQITCDNVGGIAIQPGSGQVLFASYTPGSSSNWAGSPSDVWSALDRLAAAVAGLLGFPIP